MDKHKSKEAFFQRLNNLAEVKKTSIKETTRNLGSLIDYKRAADGVAYGIIKENHQYYIKRAGLKQDPNVADFAYIGGLSNITNYQFQSLSEADKQRNMLFHTITETSKLKPNINGSNTKKRLLEGVEEGAKEEIDAAEKSLGAAETAASVENSPPPVPTPTDIENTEDAPADVETPAPDTETTPDTDSNSDIELPDGIDGGEDISAETNPEDSGNESPDGETNTDGGNNEELTKLQKDVGSIANEIKNTELKDSESVWLLKSFIQGFVPNKNEKGDPNKDKMSKLSIDDRQEISDLILKVVPDEDIANLDVSKEDESIAENEMCAECGGFGSYAESRGYTKESIMECGNEEMSSLISGYANAHNDGQNDGDFKLIALLANPEVLAALKNDYGHDEYVNKIGQAPAKQMNEDKTLQIEGLWGGLKGIGQGIKQAYQSGSQEQDISKLSASKQKLASDFKRQIDAINATASKLGQPVIDANSIMNTITGAPESANSETSKFAPINGNTPPPTVKSQTQYNAWVQGQKRGGVQKEGNDIANTEVQPNMGFAKEGNLGLVAETKNIATQGKKTTGMNKGVAFNKPVTKGIKEAILNPKQKGVAPQGKVATGTNNGVVFNTPAKKAIKENKLKTGLSKEKKSEIVKTDKTKTNKPTMTESEIKLRKYIRNRIEEKNGLRKSTLNESTKPEALKKLDKIIDEQFKNFKGNIDEGFMDAFSSNAGKFEKLNQADPNSINDAFNKIFSQALMAGARKQAAMKMTPEQKYSLMQQGYQMDKLKNPSFGMQGGNFIYTTLKTVNPFVSGGTGGKVSSGGV